MNGFGAYAEAATSEETVVRWAVPTRGDAEMLIEVRIPIREHGGSAYEKVERRAGDWAVTSAGAAVWLP